MVVISVPVTGSHEVSLYLALGFLHLLYVDQVVFVAFYRSWVFMICEFDIFSFHFFLVIGNYVFHKYVWMVAENSQ